jgi:hypothetical protein
MYVCTDCSMRSFLLLMTDTGLRMDPLFTRSRRAWLQDHSPQGSARDQSSDLHNIRMSGEMPGATQAPVIPPV